MTTLDEQMAAIEQIQVSQVLGLPYTITDNGVVLDSHEQRLTTRFTTPGQDAYLVACANAAPDLCGEVRRLREDLRRVQLEESLLSRVVSAAQEFVREIDPENPEENDPSTLIRVINEWHKTKPWWTEDHQLNWKMGRDGDATD